MGEQTKWRDNGGRTGNFAIGIGEIDVDCANCAPGRDLRCFGSRANHFGGENGRYFGTKRRLFRKRRKEDSLKEGKRDFEHMPGFSQFLEGKQTDVDKVTLLKKTRNLTHRKHIWRWVNLIFLKSRFGN